MGKGHLWLHAQSLCKMAVSDLSLQVLSACRLVNETDENTPNSSKMKYLKPQRKHWGRYWVLLAWDADADTTRRVVSVHPHPPFTQEPSPPSWESPWASNGPMAGFCTGLNWCKIHTQKTEIFDWRIRYYVLILLLEERLGFSPFGFNITSGDMVLTSYIRI